MEIHKPKPWNGWREFLKEYLIVVVGVLTALAAEQLVSVLDWSAKVREARRGLGEELAEDLGKSEIRVRLAPCVDRTLDALATTVDEAARTGKLPALPRPNRPPYNSWATGVWQSALSAQTASHMSADELRNYTRVYQVIDRIAGAGPQEEAVWTTLFGLAGPGRAFDGADARVYREAIGQARNLNGLTAGFGVRARQIVNAHQLPYDLGVYEQRVGRLALGRCETFRGVPPAAYGASPSEDFPELARKNPIR